MAGAILDSSACLRLMASSSVSSCSGGPSSQLSVHKLKTGYLPLDHGVGRLLRAWPPGFKVGSSNTADCLGQASEVTYDRVLVAMSDQRHLEYCPPSQHLAVRLSQERLLGGARPGQMPCLFI